MNVDQVTFLVYYYGFYKKLAGNQWRRAHITMSFGNCSKIVNGKRYGAIDIARTIHAHFYFSWTRSSMQKFSATLFTAYHNMSVSNRCKYSKVQSGDDVKTAKTK